MKNYLKNCSDLAKLLLAASALGIVLILTSIVGIVFGQPGWMIGVSLGTVVELVNIYLLYKGSELALKHFKASLFIIVYFTRMTLYIAGILVLVLMQYQFNIEVFNNSFWGFLIGITPMQAVVIIVMAKSGKSPIDIAEKKEEEKVNK